jgi:hypothetical protein
MKFVRNLALILSLTTTTLALTGCGDKSADQPEPAQGPVLPPPHLPADTPEPTGELAPPTEGEPQIAPPADETPAPPPATTEPTAPPTEGAPAGETPSPAEDPAKS